MRILHPRVLLGVLACLATCPLGNPRAAATGVPIGGFLPVVGIGLTDEYSHDTDFDYTFFTVDHDDPDYSFDFGALLGANGTPHYDIALLDTGAAVSVLTTASDAAFALSDSYPQRNEGFEGGNFITIGGATGLVQALINDPLGLYAGGVQGRNPTGPFVMPLANMKGQLNTSLITAPINSDLPNVLGLTFASQYATDIRNSQPQIFSVNGQTVRSPAITFRDLGSGGQGITRRTPLQLNPGVSFTVAPFYFPDFGGGDFTDNPSQPSIIQGGMFLNVNVSDTGGAINNAQFFFDTGADVSVVSDFTALQLGFDITQQDPEFSVAVVGSGGTTVNVPGFFANSLTIPALGGNVTLNNVPLIILNVTNPADPGNPVPGIIGTNVFSGRDIVIDPEPSLGGGTLGPQLYISDDNTTSANWASAAASSSWTAPGNWSGSETPTVQALKIANVRHVSGGNQTAVVAANANAWEVNISGAGPTQKMTLRIQNNVTLTTFAGLNIEAHGVASLEGGTLDVQYVDIRHGLLTGAGSIATGSGPVPGQVENISGTVAPGVGVGTLNIEGRFSNGRGGTVEMEIGGTGTLFDKIAVDGDVTLAGMLNLALVNGFVPVVGNSFGLITATGELGGQFGSIAFPALPADRMWAAIYSGDALTLKVTIPGDFDANGVVNGADRAAWAAGFGSSSGGAGFLAWQRAFNPANPTVGVPEPGGITLALAPLVGALLWRRRPSSLRPR